MVEREVWISTADGDMNSFVTHPEGEDNYPVVVFLMDALGKREELHDMARRIASAGYYVILPNLYYRRVEIFDMNKSTREEMNEHMNSLSNDIVCEDVSYLLKYLSSDPSAKEGKMGCVGYCMSGPFAFSLGSVLPEVFSAIASIHGVKLFVDSPDSPHLNAHKICGELYFACAENDTYAPVEMIEGLDKHLSAAEINFHIDWYENTEHGFVFPERAGRYDKPAAERHWGMLLSLFDRNLE